MTVPEGLKDPCWDMTKWAGAAGRRIDSLFIHYTLSGDLGDAEETLEAVTRWHVIRGFITVGYHRLYTRRAEVALGRPEYMMGAHVLGWNSYSLGLCAVGMDAMDWYPEEVQYQAVARDAKEMMTQYPLITLDRVWPHRAKNATSCPGRWDMDKLKQMIQAAPPPEEDKMFRWSNRNGPGSRITSWENNVFIGANQGTQTDEDFWLAFRPLDGDAQVEVKVVTNSTVRSYVYKVKRNKLQEVGLSGFGLVGPMTYFLTSDVPLVFSEDPRGRNL